MLHAKPKAMAVLLHLASTRHLDDFVVALGRLNTPWDLYVNLVRGLNSDADLMRQEQDVSHAFPDARIIVSDNRGMDIGGMFRLFEQVQDKHYHALLYLHGKSDDHWRRVMLDVLTREGDRVATALCRSAKPSSSVPPGMVGTYTYPFDYYNIGPFLGILDDLNISLRTSWEDYFDNYPSARGLSLPQRIAHARDIHAARHRPELDLDYAQHYLGAIHGERQPMTQDRLSAMIMDQVLGPLPYFPGNFFWISIAVVRALARRIDFKAEFAQLPLNLDSDRTYQSRAHAWERALPVFAAKNGFRVVGLARQA